MGRRRDKRGGGGLKGHGRRAGEKTNFHPRGLERILFDFEKNMLTQLYREPNSFSFPALNWFNDFTMIS